MMQVLPFSTDSLPPERRLPAFQQGATDYQVDAVGDPLAFGVRWRLLILGEINVIESTISPVYYHRSQEAIEADGKDRVSIICVTGGRSRGTIDGRPADVGPGDAMIFDLTRPLDMTSRVPLDSIIATIPRYLLEEVLPTPRLEGRLPASPALALVTDQIRFALDHADAIPAEGAAFHGRAIRDMFAAALLPIYQAQRSEDATAPLLRRICDLIEQDLAATPDLRSIAAALGVSTERTEQALARSGGLDVLVERRRLLAAYQSLRDPAESAPISAVAVRCGFADTADFSRRFRRTFHASPREVRLHSASALPRWAGAYHVESNYGTLLAA